MGARALIDGRWRPPIAVAVAAIALLAPPSVATGAGNALAEGETTLHLKRGFLAELNRKGVIVSTAPRGGAKSSLSLPVAGGELDPANGKGSIRHAGGLWLRKGRRGVAITKIDADTARGVVWARIAGKRMKLGFLTKLSSSRTGFGVSVEADGIELSGGAARRLSARLGLEPAAGLRSGRAVASFRSSTQPRTVAIGSGDSYLFADTRRDDAVEKLFAEGIYLMGLTPATVRYPFSGMGQPPFGLTLFLPAASGSVAPAASEGTLNLAGGIAIGRFTTALDPVVRLTQIAVDLGGRTITGAVEAGPIAATARETIATLDTSSARVRLDPAARTIQVEGAVALLSASLATRLNETLDQSPSVVPEPTDLQAGDRLGRFSFYLTAI